MRLGKPILHQLTMSLNFVFKYQKFDSKVSSLKRKWNFQQFEIITITHL